MTDNAGAPQVLSAHSRTTVVLPTTAHHGEESKIWVWCELRNGPARRVGHENCTAMHFAVHIGREL